MALSLGYSAPRYWLRSLTGREYQECRVLARLEPLGYDRDDYRHAMAAFHVVGATNGKPPDICDLMPSFAGGGAAQTDDDMLCAMGRFVK